MVSSTASFFGCSSIIISTYSRESRIADKRTCCRGSNSGERCCHHHHRRRRRRSNRPNDSRSGLPALSPHTCAVLEREEPLVRQGMDPRNKSRGVRIENKSSLPLGWWTVVMCGYYNLVTLVDLSVDASPERFESAHQSIFQDKRA